MRLLLTNDDGIHAEGLAVLERIARELTDDVWVVAPETDQSGLSHSLTLSSPLRLRKIDERRFDRLAANRCRHQVQLLRRRPQAAAERARLVVGQPPWYGMLTH